MQLELGLGFSKTELAWFRPKSFTMTVLPIRSWSIYRLYTYWKLMTICLPYILPKNNSILKKHWCKDDVDHYTMWELNLFICGHEISSLKRFHLFQFQTRSKRGNKKNEGIETALQLRVLTALPEEPSVVPSTHMGQFTTASKFCSMDPMLSSGLCGPWHMHAGTYTHMCAQAHKHIFLKIVILNGKVFK